MSRNLGYLSHPHHLVFRKITIFSTGHFDYFSGWQRLLPPVLPGGAFRTHGAGNVSHSRNRALSVGLEIPIRREAIHHRRMLAPGTIIVPGTLLSATDTGTWRAI